MAPRFSIVAGDFAEDPRADVSHFRVYLILGRHSDGEGWCRLKQITIGERIGLSRETVNRKLKDLVEWGYVAKRKADARGRAYWYRTVMDRGDAPAPVSKPEAPDNGAPNEDAGDEQNAGHAMQNQRGDENLNVTRGSHSTFESDARLTPGVSAIDHTRCECTPSHQNDPFLTSLLNEEEKTPPQPPAGGRVRGKRYNETEVTLRELTAETAADAPRRRALSAVVEPIVTQRKFDAPVISAALRALVKSVCDAGLSDAEMAAVVHIILAERRSSVKPADISGAIKFQIGMRAPARVLEGNAELMRDWPRVIDALEKRLGVGTVKQAFSTFVIDRLVRGQGDRKIAYVATHDPLRAKSVELSYSAQLRAAICVAFPGVNEVSIEYRRARG